MMTALRKCDGRLLPVGCGIFIFLVAGCFHSPTDPDPQLFDIRITEINYHPPDTGDLSGDSLEFIELKNVGSHEIDIGTLDFTDGVTYSFPTTATLSAGDFCVIASDSAAFHEFYGVYPFGVFSGKLSNSGETLTLTDGLTGTRLISITYSDSGAWPEEADGDGYSLVTVSITPGLDATSPDSWRRSIRKGGSPGEDDIPYPVDSTLFDLRITEIHYHPKDPETTGGDSLEFIELKNTGTRLLQIGTLAFTDGITYTFPSGTSLESGGFIVLASNANEFRRRYDTAPFDIYSGQLSNSGEEVVLQEMASGTVITGVEYSDDVPWPEAADGDGYSLVPFSRNPGRDQNDPTLWRCSFAVDGSPGEDEPGIVVINEVITNNGDAADDAVEVFNPGDDAVDIGEWFLSDSRSQPAKYRIPDGTVVSSKGFAVFTGSQFGAESGDAVPFSLSADGEDICISSDSGGCSKSYCHGFSFEGIVQGVSFGRYITSVGKEVFTAQKATSIGGTNEGPLTGPLVISEIMHVTSDNRGDFIEVTNISRQEVRLYDPEHSDNTWWIEELQYSFPTGSSIRSGESVVVASSFLPEDDLRERYSIDSDVTLFIFTGTVPDNEGSITLRRPLEPDDGDSIVSGDPVVPYMVVDRVVYSGEAPWPSAQTGLSLQKKNGDSFGDDPVNWFLSYPSPGKIED